MTMCFLSGEILSISHDLNAKLTRAFWLSRPNHFQASFLGNITPFTPYIRHPYFLPRQILQVFVQELELRSAMLLEELETICQDINKNAVGNNYVDGFEYFFYRANKNYFHIFGDMWSKFEQAEALGKVITEGLVELDPSIDSKQQVFFREVTELDMMRLQCFRRNIERKDAIVKRQLEIVSLSQFLCRLQANTKSYITLSISEMEE